jgi:hypothetical protein
MEITKERLAYLEDIEKKMDALEAGGVDNWSGYSVSLEQYHSEKELEEELTDLVADVVQQISEGMHEPAGRGAGWGTTADAEDNAIRLIREFIKKEITDD